MAPSRPFWKGYLKLSLVSCPIAMFPASSSSERVSFRQINKRTGNRLKQQLVDSVTGDVVDPAQKGRGYEIGRNQYMPVEDEELEALRLESTHTIDIEKFVPWSEIDERYLDSPYYLVPEDKVGQDAFAVIREAMARKNMVGLGRVVISRRERIIVLEPFDKGLMATTLHYAYEIRNAAEYFDDIPSMKLPDEMIELAEHILETKAGHFDATEFEDRYETAVIEMLKRKQAGLPPAEQPEAAAPTNVVNLMDALRRSVEGEKPTAARGKSAPGSRLPGPQDSQASDRQGRPWKLGRPFHTQIGSTILDLAARFLFACDLDHRAMCSSILSCRHVPDSGGEGVSSFGSSGAEYFGGMAQECVRWLPGCIGPVLVADPGSVTTVLANWVLGRTGERAGD